MGQLEFKDTIDCYFTVALLDSKTVKMISEKIKYVLKRDHYN